MCEKKMPIGLADIFVMFLGGVEIIALPFMYSLTSFSKLSNSIILILLLVIMIVIVRSKIIYHIKINNITNLIKWCKNRLKACINIYMLMALCVVIFQVLVYCILLHEDADDSFYISITNTALADDTFHTYDPASGIQTYPFQVTYSLVVWELLEAIICNIFDFNAAALAHVYLPIVLLIIHYYIIWELLEYINKDFKSILFFVYTCMNIMGGNSVQSPSSFIAYRLGQGKAVLVAIIFPYILLQYLKIINKKIIISKQVVIMLTVAIYAGFATSAVALYLVPLMYATFLVSVIIFEKKIKPYLYLVIPLVLCLPYIILKFVIIHRNIIVDLVTQNSDDLEYINILRVYVGANEKILLFIFGVAISIIAILGSKENKCIFVIYTIICIVTFLNPLFASVIAERITGTSVYWRLFWLLQPHFVVLCAISEILSVVVQGERSYNITIIIVVLCIWAIGKTIYTKDNFSMAENIYKVKQSIVDFSKCIPKESVILLPEEYALEMRQYTGDIKLAWNRYMRMDYRLMNMDDKYNVIQELMNKIYLNNEYNLLEQYYNYCKFDYFGIYTETNREELSEYQCIYSDPNITIYKWK